MSRAFGLAFVRGAGSGAAGGRRLGGQRRDVGLDRHIARRPLLVIHVEPRQVLLQHEDVLGAVMAGERRDDSRLRGLTPGVPMLREGVGVGLARHAVADNALPGPPRDIAEHDGERPVHLAQRLLHALDVRGGALHQGLAVAQIGAPRGDGGGRPDAAPQQAHAVQLLQPLAVQDIALAGRDVLHVPRVDEHHGEAAGREDLVQRDPVDPGGFHRHGGDAAGLEPVGEAVEVRGEGRERAHRGRIPVGGDGHVMHLGPAIDAGGIGGDALQAGEAGRRLLPVTTRRLLHGRLLSTA